MTQLKRMKWLNVILALIFAVGGLASTWTTSTLAQYTMGGDKKKKDKDEDKPQFPYRKFKGTVLTVKLEERRFLLDSENLAVLVQVDDKTKFKFKKEKKGASDPVLDDLKKGVEVEVSGQLPPSRILQAEKVILLTAVSK
ncbi:MAG: hypothetical protein PHX83_03705 [Acidobacteriia bacterium]|nr:hypothetical protein [Terriglobia bacterium]